MLEKHLLAIENAIQNKDACKVSENQPRTHPFNHTLPRETDGHANRIKKLTKTLNKRLETALPDKQGASIKMTTYLTPSACEDAVASILELNKEAIAEWLENAEKIGTQNKAAGIDQKNSTPQRMTLTTDGYLNPSRGQYDENTQASDAITTPIHTFSDKEIQQMTNGAVALIVQTAKPVSDEDRTIRRPAIAYLEKPKSHSVTLQYNPDSPYGFDVVTAYPTTQKLKHDMRDPANNDILTKKLFREAFPHTDFAKVHTTSRAYDLVSIAARFTKGMTVWLNNKDNPGIEITVEPSMQNRYKSRFCLHEDGIAELKRNPRTNEMQQVPVSRRDPRLAPIRNELDNLFGTKNPERTWPKPGYATEDFNTYKLLEEIRSKNMNPRTGMYRQNTLAIYSQKEPVKLVMTSFDQKQRTVVSIEKDGIYLKPSPDAKEKQPLTREAIAKGGKTPLAREIQKFAREFDKILSKIKHPAITDTQSATIDEIVESYVKQQTTQQTKKPTTQKSSSPLPEQKDLTPKQPEQQNSADQKTDV